MIALTKTHTVRIVALAMLVFPALILQPDSALALEFRVSEDIVIGADEVMERASHSGGSQRDSCCSI